MKKRKVILADSHQNMLEGIRGLLEIMFDTVVMVADENSMFEAIENIKPDLMVVDLSLPVSGESNIVVKIKSCYPDLKFIVLSVHDESAIAKEMISSGASGFVLKRSIAFDLIPAIKKIMQGQTYISPSVKSHS
ncbi:MAG TPA: response regulator transcription factor [Nitrospinota bacterium]|nr:response regulator transcription factor [Nitrospinota bacterium]